jgi:hypothetical protein
MLRDVRLLLDLFEAGRQGGESRAPIRRLLCRFVRVLREMRKVL